jgi:DNA-binding MarR family transcriptional regulator
MLMHRQTRALLANYDFTPVQYVLLALLDNEDGITQQELTRRASSDPNTIRATLLLLERGGAVTRRSNKADRRSKQIYLTAKGRRTYSKLSTALMPLQVAMLAPFTHGQAEALVAQLLRLAEALKSWERTDVVK